jgi:hypothetical protein
MARPIDRIERDIIVLQEAIGAIAAELQNAYASYLTSLGQAVRRQLILASYHLCTQGYPENFLNLSLNQRQQLQQALRKLGKKAAEELLMAMRSQENEHDEEDEGDEGGEGGEGDEGDEENNSSLVTPGLNPTGLISSPSEADISNAMKLVAWHQNLEEVMQNTLKKVSHEANVLLQKAGVLPKKLPEPILEAAAAAAAVSEASAEVIPGPPNLLNLVIEIENEEDAQDSSLTQVMALNLRLGEIEFTDSALSSGRKQIRNILIHLNKVGRDYQKKQRELSSAKAEAAWRAIWVDD